MRDRDRFWWVMLSAGLGFCIVSIAFPWNFVNQFPLGGPYSTPADDMQTVGMLALIGLICLGGSALIIAMALRARERHQKRLAAFRGDLVVMPLATIQPQPNPAPDVTAQPLEVMWRVSRGNSALYLLVIAPGFLAALALLGMTVFALIKPIVMPPQPTERNLFLQTPPAPMSVHEIVLHIALTCAVIALAVGVGVYVARILPLLFGRPFGVRATAEGIEARTVLGSRIHIAWSEAILFEVSSGSVQASRAFALYAPGRCVTWSEYRAGGEYVPAGATAGEMALRQAALLNLITARTGQEPRTLVIALRRDLIRIPSNTPQAGTLVPAILALLVAGLAIGEYQFPITPYLWANGSSVGALALLAIFLVMVATRSVIRQRRTSAQPGPPAATVPALDAPGIAYALSWRVPALRRAGFVSAGLLLAVNLIPAAIVAPQAISGDASAVTSPLGSFWRVILATLLGGAGLAGVLFALLGNRSTMVHIRADVDGLTHSGGTASAKLVAWANMREVVWRPRGLGDCPAYILLTNDPLVAITWPTAPRYLDISVAPDGAVPTSPDELAALVAAKIGRPIRILD